MCVVQVCVPLVVSPLLAPYSHDTDTPQAHHVRTPTHMDAFPITCIEVSKGSWFITGLSNDAQSFGAKPGESHYGITIPSTASNSYPAPSLAPSLLPSHPPISLLSSPPLSLHLSPTAPYPLPPRQWCGGMQVLVPPPSLPTPLPLPSPPPFPKEGGGGGGGERALADGEQ